MIYYLTSILKYALFPFIDLETFVALVKVSKQFSSITIPKSITIPINGSKKTSKIIDASNIYFASISFRSSCNPPSLDSFPRLKYLRIAFSNRKRPNLDFFKSLEKLVDLVSFELISCNFDFEFNYYYNVRYKRSTMTFNRNHTKKNNAGTNFSNIFCWSMKKLEQIKLTHCKGIDDTFFTSLKELPNLKTLILEDCTAKISKSSIKNITEIKKLETLCLSHKTSIDETDLRNSLSKLKYLMYVKYPSGTVEFIRTEEKPYC